MHTYGPAGPLARSLSITDVKLAAVMQCGDDVNRILPDGPRFTTLELGLYGTEQEDGTIQSNTITNISKRETMNEK